MTWSEIKKAVEEAGVEEQEEISVIQCEPANGSKTFHRIKLGRFVKLAEDFSEASRKEANGCLC